MYFCSLKNASPDQGITLSKMQLNDNAVPSSPLSYNYKEGTDNINCQDVYGISDTTMITLATNN